MATFQTTGGTTYRLGASIGSTDTTIILSSFYEPISNTPYTMALIGSSICYGTVAPQSTQSEFISFTGITQNADGTATLTGVVRGIGRSTPYASSATFQLPHAGQSIFILSDSPQVFSQYPAKNNAELVPGNWTFSGNVTFNTSPSSLAATLASTTTLGNVKLTSVASTTIGTCTISIASPAVVSFTAHGLISGDLVQFTTTGALPTGITAGTTYYVIAAGLTANAFEISLAPAGTAVNTSGSQSGTQTLIRTTPFAVGNDDPRVPNTNTTNALVGTSGTPSTSNKFVTQNSLTLTPVAGGVPLLDSNGFIPVALLEERGGTYVTSISATATNASTQTITHSLGYIPKYVEIMTYFTVGSLLSSSTGVATVTSGGVASYNTVYFNSNSSGTPAATNGVSTTAIMNVGSSTTCTAVLGTFTTTTFVITFSTSGSAPISYLVKVT
jgi:hypothetical protein